MKPPTSSSSTLPVELPPPKARKYQSKEAAALILHPAPLGTPNAWDFVRCPCAMGTYAEKSPCSSLMSLDAALSQALTSVLGTKAKNPRSLI